MAGRTTPQGRLQLSKKHGVNPCVRKPQCFYCLEDKPEDIVLFGKLPNDAEAPMTLSGIMDMEPCEKCAEWMTEGIICISVQNGEEDRIEKERLAHSPRDPDAPFIPNPFRTGGWAVLKDDWFTKNLDPETAKQVLALRWTFIPDEVWDMVGFPRPTDPDEHTPDAPDEEE